jgi:type II secretory pathway pseudopilin PulG
MARGEGQGSRFEESESSGEQGFMLLGLMVAIAIILLVLGVAASTAAFSLRRDKELESARRADQYVRAIRKFYIKNQHYPGSIEQLENTNNIRYLRQQYVDPLTGKADYRLILVGKNKTVVPGFFGQPLGGLSTTGLGSLGGTQTPGIGGTVAGGANGANGGTGVNGGSGLGGASGPGAAGGGLGGASAVSGSSSAAGGLSSPSSGTSGSGEPGSKGPFVGVGSSATGPSILTVNQQTSYDTWEFLYDPRVEQLKAAAALNAGVSSLSASALGNASSSSSGSTSTGSQGTGSGGNATPAPQP